MIYRFERRGRSPSTLTALILVWIVLIVLTLWLNMSIWIALFFGLFTLPALWDVIRDSRGSLEVWPNRIVWASTLGAGDRNDIDHVRLNRRFDGTMKVTLVHIGGATTRLPPDIGAPVEALETALKEAGISAERHPFSPI